jgi:hypothetical protein
VAQQTENTNNRLPSGTRVEVRDRFGRDFHPGFEVSGSGPRGYQLVRLSDRAELPAVFAPDDVRAVR